MVQKEGFPKFISLLESSKHVMKDLKKKKKIAMITKMVRTPSMFKVKYIFRYMLLVLKVLNSHCFQIIPNGLKVHWFCSSAKVP